MTITAGLLGSLQVSDSQTGTTPLVKQLINLLTTGTTFSETQQASLANGTTAITLPISPVTFLYVKNLHAVNTIVITWTPQGGSTATIVTLQPGGYIAFGTTAGISALSLVTTQAATTVEYVLAG